MIALVRKILELAGDKAKQMKWAFVFSFFNTVFETIPFVAIAYVLLRYTTPERYGAFTIDAVWVCTGIVLVSFIGRYITIRMVYTLMRANGFKFIADERIKTGNLIKRFPMGVFRQGSLGKISSIVTSDLSFIEMNAMKIIDQVIVGYAATVVIFIFLVFFDWQIALIAMSVLIPAMLILQWIQKVSRKQAKGRQQTHEELASAVLEYTQGMSVIKAYNLSNEKAKQTDEAFTKMRDQSTEFEKKIIPPVLTYYLIFAFGTALVIFSAPVLSLYQSMAIPFMFLMLIIAFRIYAPLQKLGDIASFVRIMEAALNRYEALKQIEIIDSAGKDIKLEHWNIEFNHVSFAYEDNNVIKDMSFTIKENTMTALVGPSGCGKTTVVNLISRFWDADKGKIKIGGVDVKDMTCDSLLKNISMVFQKVYLFNDTVIKNLKFGNPNASDEMVLEAAKKARCHDFIMKMENGYDTIIGEGGATLSGGEKQRLSIARAMLKDAPIVLLDEATSNIDPENELLIQRALSLLVRNKTLIVIAHRLSNIKSADQILVIDNGQIVERGVHTDLINTNGLYQSMWRKRSNARSWKIGVNETEGVKIV